MPDGVKKLEAQEKEVAESEQKLAAKRDELNKQIAKIGKQEKEEHDKWQTAYNKMKEFRKTLKTAVEELKEAMKNAKDTQNGTFYYELTHKLLARARAKFEKLAESYNDMSAEVSLLASSLTGLYAQLDRLNDQLEELN